MKFTPFTERSDLFRHPPLRISGSGTKSDITAMHGVLYRKSFASAKSDTVAAVSADSRPANRVRGVQSNRRKGHFVTFSAQ